MGTRYEDQPPDHWAGPASLDPTPVWKQYLLVLLLAFVALLLIGVVALFSLAPLLVAPPAHVVGGRVVLARADVPAAGAEPRLIGSPISEPDDAFWLVRTREGEVIALRQRYTAWRGAWECDAAFQREPLVPQGRGTPTGQWFVAGCREAGASGWTFGPRGEPLRAPRALDRYLVAMEGDRVIVNVSRVIRGAGPTPQPTPTGR